MNRPPRRSAGPRGRQRGVVLFVALIAMVVLSLAGVALVRSVDTNTSVIGNLAFRQASITPVNAAIETAADALFYAKTINPFNHDPANNYFANLQPGERPNGVPAVLFGNPPPYPAGFQTPPPDAAGNTVRWVIERICQNGYFGDPVVPPGDASCDSLDPKLSPGKTTMKPGGLPVPPIPIYRVTIRVDGPRNTVSFAQAMLR